LKKKQEKGKQYKGKIGKLQETNDALEPVFKDQKGRLLIKPEDCVFTHEDKPDGADDEQHARRLSSSSSSRPTGISSEQADEGISAISQ